MPTLKKIDPPSAALTLGAAFGAVGIVAGILYSFGGLLVDIAVTAGLFETSETPGLSFGNVLAFGALIGMPALFAGAGFVAGAFGALFYNITAKRTGGVRIEI